MRPGNISMILAETGGVRVQVTSPGLGAANVRVQGMRGRYTQLLADGLPLYGGQASSLGLLQIPPSDLGQVEVIKGAASALYGGQALGGIINLISKRPGDAPEGELILNATTRDGQDVSAYGASPSATAGAALFWPPTTTRRFRTWTATAGSTWRGTIAGPPGRGCSGTAPTAPVST